jgi:heme A synthase
MTDNRKSGLALIAGSLGMIVTMAVHPHGAVAAAQVESMARNLTIVHSLALASLMVLFLGTLGLSQRLKSADRFDKIGLVLFAFASIAVMNAAVMDGLVAPNVMRRIVEAAASAGVGAGESWRVAFRYNFEVNQGFARLYAITSSIAIIFWSLSIWRNRTLARGLAIYGCVIGVASVIAVTAGLGMDVHGFGAVVLGQAIWFVTAGVLLQREPEKSYAPSRSELAQPV